MNEATINISFDNDFLNKIDTVAKAESLTRTELIYNSIKIYIDYKQRLKELYEYGKSMAKKNALTENDIFDEIKKYRNENEDSH